MTKALIKSRKRSRSGDLVRWLQCFRRRRPLNHWHESHPSGRMYIRRLLHRCFPLVSLVWDDGILLTTLQSLQAFESAQELSLELEA